MAAYTPAHSDPQSAKKCSNFKVAPVNPQSKTLKHEGFHFYKGSNGYSFFGSILGSLALEATILHVFG